MASTDLEKKAKEAFVDDDFELAVDLYTQALDLDPQNADLYTDRAQANIKLGNFTEAVSDANKAIGLNSLMIKAYLRKGIACMKLEEYQTARTALAAGLALAPGDSRFNLLVKECEERIAEEIKEVSKAVLPNSSGGSMPCGQVFVETANNGQPTHDLGDHLHEQVQIKPKFRHDYYNTSTELVLNIFAKGISQQNVHVEFGEQILSVSVDVPGEDSFHFQPRLFGKIIPEKCKYVVLPSKIEIRLVKAEAASWPSLDKALAQKTFTQTEVKKNQRPSYPSSRNKVEWDKLEAEVKKEEKDEKMDGDAALNKLFRDIYQNADEDMRRAMCKSFVESNGTVLSTNWEDVGSKKVEGSAPDGMEMKKWEY